MNFGGVTVQSIYLFSGCGFVKLPPLLGCRSPSVKMHGCTEGPPELGTWGCVMPTCLPPFPHQVLEAGARFPAAAQVPHCWESLQGSDRRRAPVADAALEGPVCEGCEGGELSVSKRLQTSGGGREAPDPAARPPGVRLRGGPWGVEPGGCAESQCCRHRYGLLWLLGPM